jgi:hypothetical protein
MNLALQKIEELQEKPMFIEKAFLETLMQQPTITIPVVEPQPEPTPEPTLPPASSPEPALSEQYETNEYFYPYAKSIPSDFKILDAHRPTHINGNP